MIDLVKLLRLTPRDQAGVLLDLVNVQHSLGVAAASVTDSGIYQVPFDRLLIITSMCVQMIPGAAQAVLSGRAFAGYANRNLTLFGHWSQQGIVINDAHFQNGTMILVPPGGSIGVTALFTAGAAVNVVNTSLIGVSIPRGSISVT